MDIAAKLNELVALTRRAIPEFQGFSNSKFEEWEVAEKHVTAAFAQERIGRAEMQRLVAEEAWDEIVTRLEEVGRKAGNLLYNSTPNSGDMSILYAENLDKATFGPAMLDLLHGPDTTRQRLDRFVSYCQEQELPCKWAYTTLLLFMLYPDTEMFVKPTVASWFLKFMDSPIKRRPKPEGTVYAEIKRLYALVREAAAPLGPRDNVDVQGLVFVAWWVATGKSDTADELEEVALAEPFASIFIDREEAEWAFDLMRETLKQLGVDGPDDERFAVVYRKDRGNIHLDYANWLVLGFCQLVPDVPPDRQERLRAALLTEGLPFDKDPEMGIFARPEGEPEAGLFYVPVDALRSHDSPLREQFAETLGSIVQHKHYSASPFRRWSHPDLIEAVFDPEKREALFAAGLSPLPPNNGKLPDDDLPQNTDSFFAESSFDLFRQLALAEDPKKAFYLKHKDEFAKLVEDPLQDLMRQVARRLPEPIQRTMETEKGVFARILKNDYGRGGAWPWYWGAFYPKGGKRIAGAQLFVSINAELLEMGFAMGEYTSDVSRRFVRNCKQLSSQLAVILTEFFDDPRLRFGRRTATVSTRPDPDWRTWLQNPDSYELYVDMRLERSEAVVQGREHLVAMVEDLFFRLFPLILLAISDDPLPEIERFLEIEDDEEPANDIYPLSAMAADTGFPLATLERWARAIERKKQAVLYGPPGTGKTFVAEKLAKHLIGGGHGFCDLVQFHPAYAYEDFVQGLRPEETGDGQLTYRLAPGRLLEFVRRAERVAPDICVLIIDEINRANLSRVLGELMYLLEYRDQSIPLAGGGTLRIPDNVRLIGTMNTADRSIALVDHALRRRFAFLELAPQYDVLTTYHQKNATGFDPAGLIAVLKDVNRQIGDKHYAVGISFFMHSDMHRQIEDIWTMEIVPYLEEYFIDASGNVDSFCWNRVRDRLCPNNGS